MASPPSGTVTFLFTDIEGSTKRWEQYPQQMRAALQRHDAILRAAIEEHGGHIFKTMGDAFCAAFSAPHHALIAAMASQHALNQEQWPEEIGAVKVRMALHIGAVEEQGGDYFGQPLNRVARLLSAGHGGQTLLSDPAYDLVRDNLPAGITLTDLGEHRLKDLTRPEHIFQLAANGLPSEFPPLKTLDNQPNNLPMQHTELIGREKEVAEIVERLHQSKVRLLTLTGPGGTGKTRLALQAGAEMLDDYSDGVWFVNLAPIADQGLVISTITQTLGVKEAAGQSLIQTLNNYLREKSILLVLDNFEQVVEASPLVNTLIEEAQGLKVLTTSRVPLRVQGEYEYAVPPLSLPNPRQLPPLDKLTQYEAVRLFIERARAIKADFSVTNENAPAVAQICARLDGLPLAIELAAARIRLLTPQAILSRLENRLKLLTGGSRDVPSRQQTLRGAIEWSYDLLAEDEKKLFRRLAVFVGGRTLEAIEAVCDTDGDLQIDMLDGVASLVSKSLMRQEEGVSGEPRFVMLETIHEYAREKLEESGEEDEVRRDHASYFLEAWEEALPYLRGAGQQAWLNRLEQEHDNLRAALDWAEAMGELDLALRLGRCLAGLWFPRGYWSEGRARLAKLLSHVDAEQRSIPIANVLQSAGYLAYAQTDVRSSGPLLEAALSIFREFGKQDSIAAVSRLLGQLSYAKGNFDTGYLLVEESVALFRDLARDGTALSKSRLATALRTLGWGAREQWKYDIAAAAYEESIAVARDVGDRVEVANSLRHLAILMRLQDALKQSASLLEQSLQIARELDHAEGISYALLELARTKYKQGLYNQATEFYRQSLRSFSRLGDSWAVLSCINGIGSVLGQVGRLDDAVHLWAAVEGKFDALEASLGPSDLIEYEQSVARVRNQLDDTAWNEAWAEGEAMNLEETVAYALDVVTPEDTSDE